MFWRYFPGSILESPRRIREDCPKKTMAFLDITERLMSYFVDNFHGHEQP
jgi:hypothetical protein